MLQIYHNWCKQIHLNARFWLNAVIYVKQNKPNFLLHHATAGVLQTGFIDFRALIHKKHYPYVDPEILLRSGGVLLPPPFLIAQFYTTYFTAHSFR